MMRFSRTSLIVIALVASVSLADQFVSVNDFTYRDDNPTATDVVFRVTMTFTPAADIPAPDNKYEYTIENLTTDLTATLFRVANPDNLSKTMSGPSGWVERVVPNCLWEDGELLPGATLSGFEILTPGLLPDLVTPPFALEGRGWIVTHPVGEVEPPFNRIDVFGPIIHRPPVLTVEVVIDIKPGSCPNPFNGKSKGSVPVAIVGSEDFDVTLIDPDSLMLNGVPIVPENVLITDVTEPGGDNTDCFTCFEEPDPTYYPDGTLEWEYSGDGFLDMVVKFDTQALAAEIAPVGRDDCVGFVLTGTLLDGTPIEGSDTMVIKTKIK